MGNAHGSAPSYSTESYPAAASSVPLPHQNAGGKGSFLSGEGGRGGGRARGGKAARLLIVKAKSGDGDGSTHGRRKGRWPRRSDIARRRRRNNDDGDGIYGSVRTAGTSAASSGSSSGMSVFSARLSSAVSSRCFRGKGGAAAERSTSESVVRGDGDGGVVDATFAEAKSVGPDLLAAAAAGAAPSARRSALFARRRSSAQRAARLAGPSKRRSAMMARRVSPGKEALQSALMLTDAAGEMDDRTASEAAAELIDAGNFDVEDENGALAKRRRSSLLLRRGSRRRLSTRPEAFAVSLGSCKPGPTPTNHPECLGTVRYRYSGYEDGLGAARAESLRTRRPLFVVSYRRHLCYGNLPLGPHRGEEASKIDQEEEPLSHPLLVEAAETLFVPVLREIKDDHRDNKEGDCACDCEVISPPSSQGAECFEASGGATLCLADPRDSKLASLSSEPLPRRLWTVGSVASAMATTLRLSGAIAPAYLDLLVESEGGNFCGSWNHRLAIASAATTSPAVLHRKEAYLGTSDVRRAEAELARLDGVVSTLAGAIGRQRAILASYDPCRLSFGMLLRSALALDVADKAIYVQSGEEVVAARMELNQDHLRALASRGHRVEPPTPRPCCSFIREYPSYQRRGRGDCDESTSPALPFHLADAAERKSSLRTTPLSHVPLTGLQSARANLLVRQGRFDEAVRLLSPRQGVIFMAALKTRMGASISHDGGRGTGAVAGAGLLMPDLTDVPLTEAWRRLVDSGVFDE